MNKTEKIAYQWLTQKLGKTNVHYQNHNSPTFTLSNESMSYEAKRLYGHTIWFYENQFQKLKKLGDQCEIIIIEDDKWEPVALIPMSDIEANTVVNNILVRVITTLEHIPISPETKVALNKVGAKLNKKDVSYEEIIQSLLSLRDEK